MLSKTPTAAIETSKFEPPALMKGKEFPAAGNNPTITPIFIKASVVTQKPNPAASRCPNSSEAFFEISKLRHNTRRYIKTNIKAPSTPVSSPITAKMLSE
jgi:hypothetical protein